MVPSDAAVDKPMGFDYLAVLKNDPTLESLDLYPHVIVRNLQIVRQRLSGETLEAIGDEHGVTRERVRQIVRECCGDEFEAVRAEWRQTRQLAMEREVAKVEGFIARHPGMTIDELSLKFGKDVTELRSLISKTSRKLIVGQKRQPNIPQVWSNDQILASLQKAQTYYHPLRIADFNSLVNLGEVKGPSVPLIMKRFGSWSNACRQAGVEFVEATSTYTQNWSRYDLLEALGAYLVDVSNNGSIAGYDEWRTAGDIGLPSSSQMRLVFVNWSTACDEALTQIRFSTWDSDE